MQQEKCAGPLAFQNRSRCFAKFLEIKFKISVLGAILTHEDRAGRTGTVLVPAHSAIPEALVPRANDSLYNLAVGGSD